MSRSASKAMLFVILMISASVTPMVGSVSASDTILLSLDNPHIVLQGGDSANLTLTIENNGSSIEHYNISLDTDGLSNVWTVNLVNNTTSSVIPTQSTTVDLVVVLAVAHYPLIVVHLSLMLVNKMEICTALQQLTLLLHNLTLLPYHSIQ